MADDVRLDKLTAEADDLLAIEDETAEQATAGFRTKLDELVRSASAAWVKLYGSPTARPTTVEPSLLGSLLGRLRSAQAALVPRARSAIRAGAERGAQHGVDTAVDAFPDDFEVEQVAASALADAGYEDEVNAIISAGRKRSRLLLVPEVATTLVKTLLGIAAGGDRTANEIERAARTAVNAAATAGAREVAKANGVGLLWVAERDACVHCLAYAGRHVKPGEPFPDDLTYGDKPLKQPDVLHGPPLHPNCRCTVRPFDPEWEPDLPRALEREARRSIALGFKLDSESSGVRLRAADKLLSSGKAGLPKTVAARARRAVAAGTFADRRRPQNR